MWGDFQFPPPPPPPCVCFLEFMAGASSYSTSAKEDKGGCERVGVRCMLQEDKGGCERVGVRCMLQEDKGGVSE